MKFDSWEIRVLRALLILLVLVVIYDLFLVGVGWTRAYF